MDYKLYQCNLIKENYNAYVNECNIAFNKIKKEIKSEDTTWNYYKYNLFYTTSTSILFYNLYKELNFYIRDFIGNDQPLWLQCWLNYHKNIKVLSNALGKDNGFHGHLSKYHGYISIDPQNTITKFRNGLEIKNKIGQVYIGPGDESIGKENGWDHLVEVVSPSLKPRITIAFDIETKPNLFKNNMIPLL